MIARSQQRIKQKVFIITADLRGFCTDGVFCFAWSPRENTKKAFWVVHFDGCMRDGPKQKVIYSEGAGELDLNGREGGLLRPSLVVMRGSIAIRDDQYMIA